MIGSMPWGHAWPDLLWQPREAGKIRACWQVYLIVGGVGNGATEEDWHWDLNPGAAAIVDGWDHTTLVRVKTTGFGVLPFATWLRKQERPGWEGKG